MNAASSISSATDRAPQTGPSRGYLWSLLAMLMSATIFEGYDITIFHLCTPDIARTFHLGNAAIGAIATAVRFGGILSFFVVTLADRYGRKPVIAHTVLLYAFFTLCTALSTGMLSFTLFQSASQVFLAAEFCIAVTIICEEFPDELRGRGISILHMVAFLGVAAAGILYGHVAESSWGWRGMYLIGIAPLLVVAWLRRGIRETVRFESSETARRATGRQHGGILDPMRRCFKGADPIFRRRLLLTGTLCNCIGLVGGPTISFFSLYAKRDHHWTSSRIGITVVFAYLMGTLGTLLCGYLLDRIGRRLTTALFFAASAVSMAVLFRTPSDTVMLLAMMTTMFSYQAARTAMSALTSELFPTASRATGYSLTSQVFGQLGWTLSPLAVGLLAATMGGLGKAASLFAAGPLLGLILIIGYVPETRGRTLEELSPEDNAAPPIPADAEAPAAALKAT
jgi:MFS transporter, putative metabolite:H+ symporter